MEEMISLIANPQKRDFTGTISPVMQCKAPVLHKVRNVLKMARLGSFAGLCYGFFSKGTLSLSLVTILITSLTIGFFLGLILGFIEEFILHNKFKRRPMYSLLITRTIIYALTAFSFLVVFISLSSAITLGVGFFDAMKDYLRNDMFKYDLIFSVSISFLINFMLQIDKFFGPGVFKKILSGKYHSPREEERIFMFVDLKGSTGMAEKLGDLKFSLLLQDFFYDVNQAISYTDGEIYQYVGDEVVVSWPINSESSKEKCIECFFLIQVMLNNKKAQYMKQYKVIPEFKAGIHYGKVIAAWVGEIKKEIVYHGDVLNTTARILSQCNELNQNLLISEGLFNLIGKQPKYKQTLFNDIFLKGKKNPLNLVAFSI